MMDISYVICALEEIVSYEPVGGDDARGILLRQTAAIARLLEYLQGKPTHLYMAKL